MYIVQSLATRCFLSVPRLHLRVFELQTSLSETRRNFLSVQCISGCRSVSVYLNKRISMYLVEQCSYTALCLLFYTGWHVKNVPNFALLQQSTDCVGLHSSHFLIPRIFLLWMSEWMKILLRHELIETHTKHPRPTQPSILPRPVNEYQLRLGRKRQVWFIPLADECGVCR